MVLLDKVLLAILLTNLPLGAEWAKLALLINIELHGDDTPEPGLIPPAIHGIGGSGGRGGRRGGRGGCSVGLSGCGRPSRGRRVAPGACHSIWADFHFLIRAGHGEEEGEVRVRKLLYRGGNEMGI